MVIRIENLRLLFCILVCCLCHYVWGRCETLFPGDAANQQLSSSCYGVIDYDVFVPDDTCQAKLESDVQAIQWPIIWSTLSKSAFVADRQHCAAFMSLFQCQLLYPSCSNNNGAATDGTLPPTTGLPPCRELCENMTMACTPLLALSGMPAAVTNCAQYPPQSSGMCNMAVNPNPTPVVPQPQCYVYNGTACRGIVDQYEYTSNYWGETPPQPVPKGLVYIYPGFTMEQMEYQASRLLFLFALAGKRDGCEKFMAPYICGQLFPACDPHTRIISPLNPGLPFYDAPFPRFPCQDVCEDYSQSCSYLWTNDDGTIDTDNMLYPNCSQRVMAPGYTGTCDVQGYASSPYQQDFPSLATFFITPPFNSSLDQFNVYTQCNNFSRTPQSDSNIPAIIQYDLVPFSCPPPLVIPDDPNAPTINDGQCATPCPVLLFSEDDYNNVDILQSTLVGFSFVLAFWVALTWIIFKQKRQQKYVLYFNLAIFWIECMLLSFVINRGGGKHVANLGCKDNSQQVDKLTDPGWCIPGGVLVLFGVMNSTAWWFFSATDLFLKIVLTWRPLETSRANKMKELFFRVSAPGLPILLLAIGIGYDIVGAADLGVAWCQFHARNPNAKNLEWAVLYFPELIIATITFAFMISIMVSLHRSANATGTARRKGWWKRYLRPIMFLAAFLCIFLWIFVFRVIAYFETDRWLNSAADWVQCLLVDQPAGIRECHPLKPEDTPSIILWNLIHIAVAGSGIYTFMIYGIMEENFRLWARLFGDCCGNDFCRIWGAGAATMRHRSSTVNAPKKGSKGNDAVKLEARSEDE